MEEMRIARVGMIEGIGILVILGSLAFSAWWAMTRDTHILRILSFCGVSCLAGMALILQKRITEISVKGVGRFRAVVQQATLDASAVADLKARVESQSATVDLVAQEASKARELSEEVADKNERAEQTLGTLDTALARANSTLFELETVTEFTMAVVAAQGDDREAFDQLAVWAKDKTYPFCARADQAWRSILDNHASPLARGGFKLPWNEGFDPSTESLQFLVAPYHTVPTHMRAPVLEYIWQRDDLPKIERLDFLMDVMRRDKSLMAVEYAGRYFTQGTNQKIKFLAVERLSGWWNEHRPEFEKN